MLASIRNATKIYGQHKALNNVSFELAEGEVHCLVGENGAGKSTLTKILSGAITPESGSIVINGAEYKGLTPRQAIELGVSTVYQEAELIESLTVADNIFLGDERRARFPLVVDARLQNAEARDLIRSLHLNLREDVVVESLSAAQKQMLQIVKAFYRDAKIIIMDEPTSSLGLEETNSLMGLIRDLKGKGIGIIYISHYLEEIFEIGDTITILKDGESMGTVPIGQIDMDTVIHKMVGRDASLFYTKEEMTPGPVQVELRHLGRHGVVEDVSFEVREGEIFGIGGLVGSGRSELLSLIFGADRRDSGEILIGGRPVRVRSPHDAVAAGICLITEDRKKLAMFAPRSVTENIAIVHNERYEPPVLNLARERRRVRGMVERLSIAVTDQDTQTISELSGGNQQKAVIGRWLLSDARLYIFDEPTKGVDVGARSEIFRLMVELAKAGKSIIMVSSDMPELISMSDRIGVMREGRLTHVLDRHGITEEKLIKYFIGV
ncbi:MAG TPA: sugar ABC transporter ATP-binding protein [Spirochaetia bacterium]|nr:sugar ABC transporter ATP-binding protein [Spirochaetia bacterium]